MPQIRTVDIRSILDPLDVPNSVKAAAWDAFHSARNDAEFRLKFGGINIPRETKADLWDAKAFTPEQTIQPKPAKPYEVSDTEATPKGFLLKLGSLMADVTEGDKNIRGATPAEYDPAGLVGMAIPGSKGATGLSFLEKLKAGPIPEAVRGVRNAGVRFLTRLRPEEQKAVEFAAKENIPVRPSTATGNTVVAGTEAVTQHVPLFAGRGKALAQSTEEALTKKAGELINPPPKNAMSVERGGTTSKEAAGLGVIQGLEKKTEGLNQLADAAYTKARKAAAANVQRVQVGTQDVPDIRGVTNYGTKTVPVFQEVASPVDVRDVKASLRPLLEELEAQIPEAQRQASPGLSALRSIMNSADVVPLSKAMDDLSAIQTIARTDLPQLRTKAQGIAAAVTKPLRAAVDRAASEAGALEALNSGRALTKQKYEIGELLDAVKSKEPVRIVERLTATGDKSIQELRAIVKASPQVAKDVGTSTLAGIIDTATNEGTFKGARAFAQWSKIGDETKALLFKPDHIKDLDSFFQLAKMEAKDFNPSGSGKIAAMGAAGTLAFYNPAAAGASVIGADVLSRLLYKADWAKLVVNAMRAPAGSSGAPVIIRALVNAAGQAKGKP